MVVGGAVYQRFAGHMHQELVAAQEVHPQDGKGDLCPEERPLESVAWLKQRFGWSSQLGGSWKAPGMVPNFVSQLNTAMTALWDLLGGMVLLCCVFKSVGGSPVLRYLTPCTEY